MKKKKKDSLLHSEILFIMGIMEICVQKPDYHDYH